jgi:hypothetical protein
MSNRISYPQGSKFRVHRFRVGDQRVYEGSGATPPLMIEAAGLCPKIKGVPIVLVLEIEERTTASRTRMSTNPRTS